MKVPTPRKLSSGKWFIQLRLGGESIPVTASTEKECVRQAQAVKAEYLVGKRQIAEKNPKEKLPTLGEAEDLYIARRSNRRSPATLRGYSIIRRTRFQDLIDEPLSNITKDQWEDAINQEAGVISPKTLFNAWGFVCSVLRDFGVQPPELDLPQVVPNEHLFLDPDEVEQFLKAAEGDKYEIPILLALCSLRVSEILGLTWENINFKKKCIEVKGAVVPDKSNKLVRKKENKNASSTRTVPILMDRLYELLSQNKKKSGPVCPYHPNTIFKAVNRVCEKAGLAKVGTHGLRHSFASLCYHLHVPELITMEIGGWNDDKTMRKIYTHIARKDMDRYQGELTEFFRNANKNAN